MFGHKSLPTKIFSYGAKPPESDEVLALTDDLMLRAHRYQNALVEAERNRRAKVEEALARVSPALIALDAAIADLEGKILAERDAIKAANAMERRRSQPKEARERIKAMKLEKKSLYARRKGLRKELFESEPWKAEQEATDAAAKAERNAANEKSGLSGCWGTYLVVDNSVKRSGPPPKFKSWDGRGHLAIQLQPLGGKGKGENRVKGRPFSVAEAFSCKDKRLRIEPVPPEAWLPGGRRLRKTKVWLRVGSDASDEPIWAVIPIVLHRPLPEDAEIKWVHLIRRRVTDDPELKWGHLRELDPGTRRRISRRYEWRVQFAVSRAAGWARPDCAPEGTVGIDVGWRIKPDGQFRVAYWAGSDGREGELLVPADWLGQMRRTEGIQSVRKKNFNEARDALIQALTPLTGVPEWLAEDAKFLPQWKSAARLAGLAIRWRSSRFAGDEAAYEALEVWRKRERHLMEFECNLRDQLQRRREDIYRNFAADMRRGYRTAVVEMMDLRDFHQTPEAEEKGAAGGLKQHVRDACLSTLMKCIKESMAETRKFPAENTTKLCPKCGHVGDFPREEIMRTCPGCGDVADQDFVAAINLLRSASDVVPQSV